MQPMPWPNWIKARTAQSVEGREIVLYLSGPDAPGPLDTLIMGAFHGDEPESAVVTTAFLQTFDPAAFGKKQIGVVPVVNPDGLQRRQRVNTSGVDLNRNFPTRDWEEQNRETIYYSGPKPASEPEARFILEILEAYPPAKIISIHTPYKVINYDGPAKDLAESMSQVNGYPVTADIGYSTPGSFGTYVGKERNIPTITLELPEEGFNDDELHKNVQALHTAIHWALPVR